MKPSFFLPLFLLFSQLSFAQLVDNFTDGDFDNNPSWSGLADKFTVTNQELQLLDTSPESANISYLSLEAPTSISQSTTWEFLVRQEFAPSSSNFARVYLAATNPDLSIDQQAYFIKIGGISGSDDALQLVRQDGGSSTVLINGTSGAVGTDPALARVRVTRSDSGIWELEADYSGGTDFQMEGTATDNTYPGSNFFGVYCRYSSTRAEHFFFDDISIDPLFVDNIPPTLLSAQALSATEISVAFDELIDPSSASSVTNFSINNGIGQPQSAALSVEVETVVLLQLTTPLQNLTDYELTTNNITDQNGNSAGMQNTSFSYLEIGIAEPQEVIITEFFADQNPVVGLPEGEFIEIHNLSNKVFQLENWTLSTGGTPQELPPFLLLPGAYLIITDTDFATDYESFGEVINVNVFPTITNSGDELSLVSAEGTLIHQVNFDRSWYQDDDKDDGGWTLELIQLDGPYDCPNNWRASIDPSGGTPGQTNSLFGEIADNTPPQVLTIEIENAQTLLLQFSETLDPLSSNVSGNYTIDPPITVSTVVIQEPERQSVVLSLENPLEIGVIYTLNVSSNLQDCMGNAITTNNNLQFGLTEVGEINDVIITEFLADTTPVVGLPAGEFIELYNRSDKILQLQDWTISSGGTPRALPSYFLQPGAYLIITDVDFQALYESFGSVISLDVFPTIPNSEGELFLASPEGTIIHEVFYDDSWYQDDSKDDGGWTLELIQLDGPYDCPNNWRASIDPSGGTPGQINSLQGSVTDNQGPSLLELTTESAFEILIKFDENLNPATASEISNYSLDQNISIADASLQEPDRQAVLLTLDAALQGGVIYTLSIFSSMEDCLGNPITEEIQIPFGLAESMEANDLVINEILFNPETGGSDFLELFNRSDKIFNLNGLKLLNTQVESSNKEKIVNQNHLIFPGDYVVLTPDPEYIDFRYQVLQPQNLLDNDLPTLGDKFGNISLVMDSITIDSFDYSDDLHFALLTDKNGVSLERLDTEAPTQNSGNWHSAAAAIDFATPTYENSQFTPLNPIGSNIISIPKTTFSPDEDGFEDVLNINYSTDRNGYLVNIRVFDAQGRLIKKIAENALLATEGSFKWDGSTLESSKARIGIYVVWMELFRPDGQVEVIKETCVVAGALD